MSESLNFGNGSNPFGSSSQNLNGLDAPPSVNVLNLSVYNNANGKLTVPPGVYLCRVESGELTTTKTGKRAYRLRFVTVEPAEHAGFLLQRWYVLVDIVGINRAKAALVPLGIRTSADLEAAYPPLGREVYVNVLVTIRPAQNGYPETNDVERFEPCDPPAGAVVPPNPFAVDLSSKEGANQ